MVCRDFILPEFCKPCLFFFLRNLFYLIVSFDPGKLGCAVYDGRTVRYYFNDRLDASMHGTGDVYASAVAGALCRGWSVYGAAALGADMVVEAMKATLDDKDHWYGVKFERALPYLMRRMEAGETETGC